jgi:hypothetical protein
MVILGLDGLLYMSEKTGARWQIEYSVKNSFQGGSIVASGTTEYSDKRLFAQVTWAF